MTKPAHVVPGTLHETSETISALAALAWPIIVALIVWKLFPFVKAIVESRAFSIKVAGMEISVQDATEQLRTQIEDLQQQVLALRGANHSTPVDTSTVLPESTAPAPANGPVLWVDDKPSANAFEIAQLESMGVPVIKAVSTSEAMDALARQPNVRAIISDMGRNENGVYHGKAGIELLTHVRSAGILAPYVVYTTAKYAQRRNAEVVAAGGDGAISSQVELLGWLKRKVGNDGA